MEIKELVTDEGKTLINVPADFQTLIEMGLSVDRAEDELLKIAKTDAIKNLKFFSKTARAAIAGFADEYQLSNWASKSQRAQRLLNGEASEHEKDILQAECDQRDRGESCEELANKQLEKSLNLSKAIGIIDGLESKGKRAIKAKRSLKTLEELVNDLTEDAQTELSKLLGD